MDLPVRKALLPDSLFIEDIGTDTYAFIADIDAVVTGKQFPDMVCVFAAETASEYIVVS
jgi:hypothetical protein